MEKYTPFQSSPVLRSVLLIVLVPSIAVIPFLPIDWNPARVIVVLALEIFFSLMVVALLTPAFSHLAWRIVCGMLFAIFVAYFTSELHKNGWKIGPLGRRPGASAGNALAWLIGLGLPCLRYSISGRLLPRWPAGESRSEQTLRRGQV